MSLPSVNGNDAPPLIWTVVAGWPAAETSPADQCKPFAPDLSAFADYLQIIFINVVLSDDNAVVIGMAAARLAAGMRARAIAAGIGAATLIRIVFSIIAVQLLAITGLLAGGLLLFWVCRKMFQELRQHRR
jgi:predicted tellurium resistance membrane protein TerC